MLPLPHQRGLKPITMQLSPAFDWTGCSVPQGVCRVASPYSVPRLVVLVRVSQPPAFAFDQGKSRRVDDPSDGSLARLPTLNQLRSWAYRVNACLSLQPLVASRCGRGQTRASVSSSSASK